MSKLLLMDIGSSTVKVYEKTSTSVSQILARTIPFKKDFDAVKGISESAKNELYELIAEIKSKNTDANIKIFATALFRKLDSGTRKSFIDEFFLRTGLYFNVISQELESFYLQVALVGEYQSDKPILLINIGGGSTELVVMYGKEAIETKNIDLGVGTILTEFTNINDEKSGVSLEKVTNFVKAKLPSLDNKPKITFYSGGELTYMEISNYKLKPNKLFNDEDHPSVISSEDFSSKNMEVFEKITLKELESLMPDNPTWMHGARACSAIAQAICEKYGVEIIIPSNSNLVNGAARQEFRHITLSGSF